MRIELSITDLILLLREFKDEEYTEDDLVYYLTYIEEENTIQIVEY